MKPAKKITIPAAVIGNSGGSVTDAATIPLAAPAFPVDARPEETKRGPGRPPNTCATCGKLARDCKGHAVALPQFGEESIKGMLQMASHFLALSISLSTGLPMPTTSQVWKFSDSELALITPPATEVINGVLPAWMITWEKELKLGFVLLPVLIMKMTVTIAMVTALKKTQAPKSPVTVSPSPAAVPISGREQPQAAAA